MGAGINMSSRLGPVCDLSLLPVPSAGDLLPHSAESLNQKKEPFKAPHLADDVELQPDPCINLSSLGIVPSKPPPVFQSSLGSSCTAVWSGAVEGHIPNIHGSLACDCSIQLMVLNNTRAFAGVELQDLDPFHRMGWGCVHCWTRLQMEGCPSQSVFPEEARADTFKVVCKTSESSSVNGTEVNCSLKN